MEILPQKDGQHLVEKQRLPSDYDCLQTSQQCFSQKAAETIWMLHYLRKEDPHMGRKTSRRSTVVQACNPVTQEAEQSGLG